MNTQNSNDSEWATRKLRWLLRRCTYRAALGLQGIALMWGDEE